MNDQVSEDDLQQMLFWEQKSKHKKNNQPNQRQVPQVQNPPMGPQFWEQFQNKFDNLNLKMNNQFSNGFPFKNSPSSLQPNPSFVPYIPMKNKQPTQRDERNNSFSFQNSSNERRPFKFPPPPKQLKQQIQHNNYISSPPHIQSEPKIQLQPQVQQQKIVIQEVCSACNQPKLANHNCNEEYGEIQCPYCSDYIIRNFLNDHLEESCLAYIEHQFKQVDATAECSICMMEIKTDKQTLKCAHSFHNNCIKVWLKKSKECPFCRSSV